MQPYYIPVSEKTPVPERRIIMRYDKVHHKSFLLSFIWVGIMLLSMGLVFAATAMIIQTIPIRPESIHTYINGELITSTYDTVRNFRLGFLLGFGIPGLGLIVAGVIIIFRKVAKKKLADHLKVNGAFVVAEILDYADSNVSINGRPALRLVCAHTDSSGTTYIFKSGFLRLDPVPYLPDAMVNVYYDQNDMSRYFVDIDGSIELGSKVVEL
jgi:hypothetical protein